MHPHKITPNSAGSVAITSLLICALGIYLWRITGSPIAAALVVIPLKTLLYLTK